VRVVELQRERRAGDRHLRWEWNTAASIGQGYVYDFENHLIQAGDADNLTEETNATGGSVPRYTQTQNLDEPLAKLRSGTTSFYEQDGLDSVTSLSSSAGSLAETYTYDSFGNLVASSGSIVNNFRYTGREFDTETNLQFSRNRYYDPASGRFLSEDLMKFEVEGPNFYLYVWNSPTNLIDPLGLWPRPPMTTPIVPILMCPWCNQAGSGAADMWNNYERMRQRNWQGDNKYYHCMGNCQATNEGSGGAVAAKVISFFRSNVWSRVFEPTDWMNDVKANKCGQQGGNCDQRCASYVPKSSPGKPPFPGW
jgi:RHS repeat-associated protein